MNESNEKNRRLLQFCCRNLRSIGLLMIILGLIGGFALIVIKISVRFGFLHLQKNSEVIISLIPLSIFNIVFYGLGILGLVQFIRYLIEDNYKPGWILKHGEKLFYLYALYIILNVIWVYATIPGMVSLTSHREVYTIIIEVISITVRIIILVSFGQILRRILPIIGESKTLV